jgi:hypothetical protein
MNSLSGSIGKSTKSRHSRARRQVFYMKIKRAGSCKNMSDGKAKDR